MLKINSISLNINNICSQNEEMKARLQDNYKEVRLYCHSSHYVLSNTHNVPKTSTRDQKAKVHFIKLHLPVPVCHKTKEIVNL